MIAAEQYATRARAALCTRWPELARYPQGEMMAVLCGAASTAEAVVAHTQKSMRFVPPSLEEVQAFLQEIGSDLDPRDFFDHYQTKGWIVGKVMMKDWRSAARRADRTWQRAGRRQEMTEWERKQKSDRLKALMDEYRDLRHPGGCAYPVFLAGAAAKRGEDLARRIGQLQKELNGE